MKKIILILILIVSLVGCATQKVNINPALSDIEAFNNGFTDYNLWVNSDVYQKRAIVIGYVYGMRVLYHMIYSRDIGWVPHPYEVVDLIDANLEEFKTGKFLANMIASAARILQSKEKTPGLNRNQNEKD